MRWFVETELFFELLDEFRVEPLRAAIFGGHGAVAGPARLAGLPGAEITARRTPIRAVAETSVPVSCAIIRSTGPPGANWMTTKLTVIIPNMVGINSNKRLIM